jgi:G3E family GTPase
VRPVSIVTGFLGSGKTTLIRRVLADPGFARTAVIVNEFGEIGLDHDIIASSSDNLIALSTGCLCCAVRGDLVATLLDLAARRAAGTIPAYDRVLIETSGLADPAPILHALMTDPDVAGSHAIDTVLTLIDAVHGEATLDRHPEARRQAALADRLLLTKTDIAGDTAPLRARLALLNAAAPQLTAIAGRISPADLFLADLAPAARFARLAALPDLPARDPFARASHTDGIETFTLYRDRPIPALALAMLLEALAEHCGARLLRVKGLVAVAEMADGPALIHGVQHVFSPPVWLESWPTEDKTTRIVFITQGVPRYFPARLLDAIEAEVLDETQRETRN